MVLSLRALRIAIAAAALTAGTLGSAGAVGATGGDPVDPSTLTPPAPDPYSCRSMGHEIHCTFDTVVKSDPFPTGFSCGSGDDTFEIWDGGETVHTIALRVYDGDGRILWRRVQETYRGASFVNPVTGAFATYTQSNTIHSVYRIPGDVTSVIESTTGDAGTVHVPGQGAILVNQGRTLWRFDSSVGDLVLVSSSGRQDFVRLIVDGDQSVLDPLCDVLAG